MSDTIKNIANLIVEEAHNTGSDNDLIGSILHVQWLVSVELIKRKNDISRGQLAGRLRKEIGGE